MGSEILGFAPLPRPNGAISLINQGSHLVLFQLPGAHSIPPHRTLCASVSGMASAGPLRHTGQAVACTASQGDKTGLMTLTRQRHYPSPPVVQCKAKAVTKTPQL